MESTGNAKGILTATADSLGYSDSTSVDDSSIFSCISDFSPIKPVNVTSFCDFISSPTIFSLPDLNPLQQVSQMRRLNDEGVPKRSHEDGVSLSSLVDNYLASPMRASRGNSSRVVNSISIQPVSNLIPTTCHDKNDGKPGEGNIIYGFCEEDLLKILPSGNCPVESDLNEGNQHGNGMQRRLQFENTLQNFTTGSSSLPYHPSNIINRSSSPANPVDPMMLKSSDPASTSRRRSPAVGFGLHLNSIFSSITSNSVATVSTKAKDKDCSSLQPTNNIFITSSPEPEITENSIPNIVNPVSEYETSDQGKVSSESDMNQVNSQKKRKRADENDGCKRCNCKKTKCLKLYCDCFAAGVYCADSCACQGCYNTPVHEATVLESRQLIESRNPFAFTPKIVVQQQYSKSPAASNGDDGNLSTPASARHKRGCNCKKSMCQKKYCECYQANVGCSDGCRCEGCKNLWGKKEDYGLTANVVAEDTIIERSDTTQDEQLRVVFNQEFFSHSPCDSTPLPPAFLHTGSEFGENQYAIPPPPPPPPPSYEQFNTPVNTIRQSQFSFTSSTLPALGNSNNLLCPENSDFSSTGSLLWPCSSLTHLNQFSGMKVVRKNELDNTIEGDDTPDILKDNYNHLYNSEKVRSPNKKRVSPPHNARVNELTERGSSSVPAMRSARKFILQSVPSYPSLSPMNNHGRQQTFLTPLMSYIDRNKPEDNDTGK